MDKPAGPIQSVARAISLLEALLQEPELGVSELSVKLGLGKSTVSRLLLTLKVRGLVDQVASGKYRLGVRLFIFGETALSRIELRKEAAPFLSRLAKISGENVSLVIPDGFEVLYIDRIESAEQLRTGVKIGARLPAFHIAVGRAILANLPVNELDRMMNDAAFQDFLARSTENSLLLQTLRQQLSIIREQGYAIDDEEYIRGVRCIAAPIFAHPSRIAAAMSVSGPSIRLNHDRIRELIPPVLAATQELSRLLGSFTPV